MSLKMMKNLDASGNRVLDGVGNVNVENVDDMLFEKLVNAILSNTYAKIAYNPDNYTEEEQEILDMLAKRSYTLVIKSYEPVVPPFMPDDNGEVIGIEDYISITDLLQRKSNVISQYDLDMLEKRNILTDIKFFGGMKYYKKSDIQCLLMAVPNNGDWSHYVPFPCVNEDIFGDEYSDENVLNIEDILNEAGGTDEVDFDFNGGFEKDIHIHLHLHL